MWQLIEDTPAGFPWLAIAGKTLTGWVVIDMDATLVTAHSDKEGAAPTWKKGYGFHLLGAWLANTRESPRSAILPRRGMFAELSPPVGISAQVLSKGVSRFLDEQ